MPLSPQTVQFITQQGLMTLVDPSVGPKGPEGTVAYTLVPANCWSNGSPFPREVQKELKEANFDTFTNEGIEYFLVPDKSSTNLPGKLAHYAQTTGVTDLINPPGGGVNRAAETFTNGNADWTVEANAVSKFVKSTDNWADARDDVDDQNARVLRQIGGTENITVDPKYHPGVAEKDDGELEPKEVEVPSRYTNSTKGTEDDPHALAQLAAEENTSTTKKKK